MSFPSLKAYISKTKWIIVMDISALQTMFTPVDAALFLLKFSKIDRKKRVNIAIRYSERVIIPDGSILNRLITYKIV